MNKGLLILVTLFCLSCDLSNKQETKDKSLLNAEGSTTESDGFINEDSIGKTSLTEPKEMLQGIWAEGEDENAAFIVEADSILYFESEVKNKYEIRQDTLTIHYGKGVIIKNHILKLTNDSLIYKTETGDIIRLSKRK